ncbi:MAG: (d)CMP kinase [Candidatus Eisenbacteria bacterium]|uniref:Cytidylate kinase n=1 Tax=Eiseniibacteriota bacterium TaxID=2212470 RepID=A0A849SNT7_UNCEI|nr:(d)CMP kinase [Candidatus Eisenbacteria bacterium]
MSFVVTIDGPAGAGKSTTARAVADALGFLYVDTGALYRAFALKVVERGLRPEDDVALEALASATEMTLSGRTDHPAVWLDGVEVSDRIRTPEVSELSSRLAARSVVRRRLVEIQRALRARGPLVAEGRDLGSVVFSDAEVKIFLDADLEARALRRHRELVERGIPARLAEVRDDLARRDERDRTRADSPLAVAPGSVVVDTSGLDIAEQVARVLDVVRRHPAFPDVGAAENRPGDAAP